MSSHVARRPTKRQIPRWVWLLAAVIFIPAQVYWVKHYWFDRTPEFRGDDNYPEFEAADEELCAALRRAWRTGRGSGWDELDFPALERVLRKAGDRGPLSLLRVVMERAPQPNGMADRGNVGWDADEQPCAMWIREHAPRELEPLLLRIARDPELHYEMRVKAVVALCRPRSASRIAALAEIALDPEQTAWLRQDIVQRAPRLSTPLLEHLRPLLYQPFHDLDQDAAIALARAGEFEAPTLLLEATRDAMPNTGVDGLLLADAILKVAVEDPDVRLAAERFKRFHQRTGITWPGGSSQETREQAERAAAEAFADAFRAWLAAHPDARDTRFERERAAFLASPRRRREESIRRFEDILEADENSLDLGAAAIWCARPEATPEARYRRLRHLEYLHRLSLLLADDIRDLEDPEAIIEAISRRLFPRDDRGVESSWEGDLPSTLQVVLRNQQGNCVGYSLLVLALGERLGLPLHGVRAPEHLFVRWDDGNTRRNIETTARGKAVTDADYHTWGPTTRPITPEDIAAGRYLRNLTRKQVIASLLNNLACVYLNSPNLKPGPWRYERARACASRAIRVDPDFASAYATRAAAAIRLDAVDRASVLRDIETALRLDQHSVRAHVMAGKLHIPLGRFRKALHHFDRALGADPDAPEARIGRIQCLLAFDRVKEALEEVESLESDHAGNYRVRSLRLTVLVRLRDARWPGVHRKLVESAQEFAPQVHLRTASLLLHPFADVEPSPTEALAILNQIPDHGLADGDDEGRVPRFGKDKTLQLVTKEQLRAIQRKRDDLRAEAEAMQSVRKDTEKEKP